MKLEPPTTNLHPNAELQAEHNSMSSPKVRNDFGAASIVPEIASLILSLSSSPTVLDVGCGNGELLRILARAGVPCGNLYGIDIEPAHVKLSRWRIDEQIAIEVADFSVSCPFDRTFEVIVALGWTWYDWRQVQAYSEPRRPDIEIGYLALVANAVGTHLNHGGYFIYDWRTGSQQYDRREADESLEAAGVVCVRQVDSILKNSDDSVTWIYRKDVTP